MWGALDLLGRFLLRVGLVLAAIVVLILVVALVLVILVWSQLDARLPWVSARRARQQKAAKEPPSSRRLAFATALRPIEPAVGRLSEPGVVAHLAGALPPAEERVYAGSAGDFYDSDLNIAMYPMRWRGLLAAERAGAAHLFDNCVPPGALWGWEVDDPTWRAALDVLAVAMRVAVLDMEGMPVTSGMRAAHRLVLEIAGSSLGAAAS